MSMRSEGVDEGRSIYLHLVHQENMPMQFTKNFTDVKTG